MILLYSWERSRAHLFLKYVPTYLSIICWRTCQLLNISVDTQETVSNLPKDLDMPTCNLRVLTTVVLVSKSHGPFQPIHPLREKWTMSSKVWMTSSISMWSQMHLHVEPSTPPCGAHNITQLLGYSVGPSIGWTSFSLNFEIPHLWVTTQTIYYELFQQVDYQFFK